MAVILEGSINRWIGLSTDTKPALGLQLDGSTTARIPAGSSFMETDTGRIYRWDGANSWTIVLPSPDEQLYVMEAILHELTELRQIVALAIGD